MRKAGWVGGVGTMRSWGAAATLALGLGVGQHPPTAADVRFMAGMIVHHQQAVLIAGWAASHNASSSVRLLCERIDVSQRDDIALLERWLRDNQQVSDSSHASMQPMPGTHDPMIMPGLLTAAQLASLDSARGPAFDRLFLTFMIQHHQGALTMVQGLLSTPRAAQDAFVFQFANGVSADQTAEIDRMRRMLSEMKDKRP